MCEVLKALAVLMPATYDSARCGVHQISYIRSLAKLELAGPTGGEHVMHPCVTEIPASMKTFLRAFAYEKHPFTGNANMYARRAVLH